MAHSIWNGSLSLGLLSIPVKVTAAARAESISFNMMSPCCVARTKQDLKCGACDKPVARGETIKGYEVEKDKYLTFSKAEIDAITPASSKVMEVSCVVNADEINPMLCEASYYLEPDTGGRQGYKLLLQAMEEDRKVAIAKMTLHQREHIIVISAFRGVLVFHTMYYHSEIAAPPAIDLSDVQAKPEQVKMARQLLTVNQEPFNHKQYSDGYVASQMALIEAKAAGKTLPAVAPTAEKPALDIMAALEQSIKAAGHRKYKLADEAPKPAAGKASGKKKKVA